MTENEIVANETLENEIKSKIELLIDEYYAKYGKNILFKKAQKNECAEIISNAISIEQLIANTIQILPGTNKVFINYLIFKTFATQNNYDIVINNLIELFQTCIDNYGSYEVHINLSSFSVSACERYKGVFPVLVEYCFKRNNKYLHSITNLYIYNTPTSMPTITQIVSPFVDPSMKKKITYYNKIESNNMIKNLLSY